MRNSSKHIGRIGFLLLAAFTSLTATSQCSIDPLEEPPSSQGMGGGAIYATSNGWRMPPAGLVRVLVILVEMDYTNPANDPMPWGSDEWQPGELPSWVDNADPTKNLFDHEEPVGDAQAMMNAVTARTP